MTRALITGASGFIGSHIAEILVEEGVHVMALKRPATDCWRSSQFNDKINWVDIDANGDWKDKVIRFMPEVVVHGAWIGVEANERNDLAIQLKNIDFLVELLQTIKLAKTTKFIALGSQAEYGLINGRVNEEAIVNPVTAYGSVKVASMYICKFFCEQNNINWIWLRLFSVFGEREGKSWLIPSVIEKMNKSRDIDLTEGNQKYAYLYVKDFAELVKNIALLNILSGIYNVSSDVVISLKELITVIKLKMNSTSALNWGVIPYRTAQSMHIEGDMSKLKREIPSFQLTEMSIAIDKTIKYYSAK